MEKYKLVNNCPYCKTGYIYEKVYEPFGVKTFVCLLCARQYYKDVNGYFIPIRLDNLRKE